uniref:Fascin-like domain-containing protein n=1 Tax=Eptatretus burgeri TaxID=7764 RepID=A0A8C4NEK9_EPTBU
MSCKTNGDGMKIHFGLINGANKYLTAESFGFKVNASGTSMKKKQIWTMEQEAEDGGAVFFKSHLGRYLAADRNGNISCDAEERDDGDCRFVVQAQADGKWAIQSQTHGRYLGGSEDRLSCFAQSMGPGELWSVHLAMHPQVNLFHVGRKRYAQLLEHELAVNADVPWGVTSLVTLDFHERRYLLKTSDNRLLLGDGSLVREPTSEALFTLEFVGGKVAFRDCQGRFLGAVGPRGSLKSSKAAGKAGKNEVFELQESRPQVVLRASNGRNVSTKQSKVSTPFIHSFIHYFFLLFVSMMSPQCLFACSFTFAASIRSCCLSVSALFCEIHIVLESLNTILFNKLPPNIQACLLPSSTLLFFFFLLCSRNRLAEAAVIQSYPSLQCYKLAVGEPPSRVAPCLYAQYF